MTKLRAASVIWLVVGAAIRRPSVSIFSQINNPAPQFQEHFSAPARTSSVRTRKMGDTSVSKSNLHYANK